MTFAVEVVVVLKPVVNDPQGLVVRDGLHRLGFPEVRAVRVGKHLELEVEGDDEAAVRAQVEVDVRATAAQHGDRRLAHRLHSRFDGARSVRGGEGMNGAGPSRSPGYPPGLERGGGRHRRPDPGPPQFMPSPPRARSVRGAMRRNGLMRFGIAVFPGTWSDRDCKHAVELAGHEAVMLWHKDRGLQDVDCVILPGGFSYGDYLRAGAVARFAPLMESVAEFAEAGGLVWGICNGFQILCEAHLLPGALTRNSFAGVSVCAGMVARRIH